MAARSLGFLFLLVCATPARGDWAVISCERQAVTAAGVVHFRTTAEDAANAGRAELHLALFTSKTATLRIIDQPTEPRARLAEVMLRENCLAGVNGGYFDPEYSAVGLLVSDGRLIAPLRKARLLSGVLSVGGGRVQLFRTGEFSSKRKVSAARQCGPFLVDRGRAVAGLNKTRSARRTFVTAGGSDRGAIGYCSNVTLAQLAQILALPGAAGELKIQRALNLDGGSSSAFWFAGNGKPFSISEQKTVRDFVAIVPR